MNRGFAGSVAEVRGKILRAAERVGRDAAGVTLVAVTKTWPAEVVAAAIAAGVTDIGENRVQEASPKITVLRERGVSARWHLIGHLQRNKVNAALGLFDIIHSIDSEELARAISARADAQGRRIPVLLEVNVAGEASKHGVTPDAVSGLAERIGALPGIELRGLMTVAPQVDDPEDVRPVFRRLRELRDGLRLAELSMGMTDDYEVAVEEGSTLVRVGRAIFGTR